MVHRYSTVFVFKVLAFCCVNASATEVISDNHFSTAIVSSTRPPSIHLRTDEQFEEFAAAVSNKHLIDVVHNLYSDEFREVEAHKPSMVITPFSTRRLLRNLTDNQRNLLANWIEEGSGDKRSLYAGLAKAYIAAHKDEEKVLSFVKSVLRKDLFPHPRETILQLVINRFEKWILYCDENQHAKFVNHDLQQIMLAGLLQARIESLNYWAHATASLRFMETSTMVAS